MTLREQLTDLLEGLESTVHVGSPRSMSVRVCHAEVPDAVDAFIDWLGLDPDRTMRDTKARGVCRLSPHSTTDAASQDYSGWGDRSPRGNP